MFQQYTGKYLVFYTYAFKLHKGYKFVMFDNLANVPLYDLTNCF